MDSWKAEPKVKDIVLTMCKVALEEKINRMIKIFHFLHHSRFFSLLSVFTVPALALNRTLAKMKKDKWEVRSDKVSFWFYPSFAVNFLLSYVLPPQTWLLPFLWDFIFLSDLIRPSSLHSGHRFNAFQTLRHLLPFSACRSLPLLSALAHTRTHTHNHTRNHTHGLHVYIYSPGDFFWSYQK